MSRGTSLSRGYVRSLGRPDAIQTICWAGGCWTSRAETWRPGRTRLYESGFSRSMASGDSGFEEQLLT